MPFMGYPTNVPPTLEPLLTDIWSLKPHPDNVRKGNVDAIARSLKVYGQQKPIVVQKSTGYIVAGNHTYRAAHQLGWTQIAASVVDMDDQTALGYLLADNRASDLATYEREKLAANLQALADGGLLEDTLWDADALDDLVAATEVALTPFEEFKGGYAISDEEIERLSAKGAESRPEVKMKEMPVVLTVADHAVFISRLAALEKAYGTPGKVATLFECVRREAERLDA